VIAILPNKVDIINDDKQKRQVTEEQIRDYARINSLLYLGEWSAKDDINVTDTLDNLIKMIKDLRKDERMMNSAITKETLSLHQSNKAFWGNSDSCFEWSN